MAPAASRRERTAAAGVLDVAVALAAVDAEAAVGAAAVTEAAAHRGAAAVIVERMPFLAIGAGTGLIRPLADSKQATVSERRFLPDFFLAVGFLVFSMSAWLR